VRALLSCWYEVSACSTVAADDPIVHTPGGVPTDIKHYWSYFVHRKTEALGENPIQMSPRQTPNTPRLP